MSFIKHEGISRRCALKAIGTTAGVLAFSCGFPLVSPSVLALEARLRDIASRKGLLYGCATTKEHLTQDKAFASLLVQQVDLLVPEADMKWKALEPTPGTFNFDSGDWLLNFARNNKLRMDGSVLVWHEALPSWFTNIDPKKARSAMIDHIRKVVGHYKGKVFSWTVVNEGVAFRGSGEEMKDTPFLRLLGPDYVDIAFRTAAEADSNVMLVYNDNHLEYDIPEDEYRRNVLLKLLKTWLGKGIPIHALGIQSHLRTGNVPFSAKKLRDWLKAVADLGLKIVISELDVTEKDSDKDISTRDQRIAAEVRRYLDVVLQEKAVVSVITWGLSSRYTWLTYSFPRADRQPLRPLPYDNELKPTRVWQALNDAFESAPTRS